jgi:transketolase
VYLRLSTGVNRQPWEGGRGLTPVRLGSRAVVVAVGPMLDPVLAATEDLDVTVAYTHTPRPFDAAGLRALATEPSVVLVEPYLAGTSAAAVADALVDRPHRLLALGVGAADLRRYGSPVDHARAHGLDPAGLRASISRFLDG